jgi:hypothetical protein
MGFQPSEVISDLMLNSLAGFLDYSAYPGSLGKSTIFAAYCTHGVIPVLSRYNPSEADGIEINQHYVVPDAHLENLTLEQLQVISDNVTQWYRSHTLSETTKIFASHL